MAQEATRKRLRQSYRRIPHVEIEAGEPDHGAVHFGAGSCAAAVMAWYFFDFVPGKLDYFVGLRFRTLAVASAQVKSKTENLARALQSGESTTNSADDFSKLVPELQLLAEAKPPADVAALQLAGGGQRAIVAWQDVVRPAAAVSQREFDDPILCGARRQDIVAARARRQHESAT